MKGIVVVAAFSLAVAGGAAAAAEAPSRPDSFGRDVYNRHCAICHGVDGTGAGVASLLFVFKPRDFTKGIYKFRSTASGQLPTDEDLERSIVRGVAASGMVPQNHLNEAEVGAVLAYVKSFSPRFAAPGSPRIAKLPAETPRASAPVERGREVYVQGGCPQCHGESGRGDGPSAATLSVPPSDLTRRPLKSGPSARDLVRTIVTGLDGTPMPSYDLMFNDADLWALAYYLESLATKPRATGEELLGWHVEARQPRSASAAQ